MSPSVTDIFFIFLIVGILTVPSALVAFLLWRKVFRRIEGLERDLDDLRSRQSEDGGPTPHGVGSNRE